MFSNENKSLALKALAIFCALAAVAFAFSAIIKVLIVAFWAVLGIFLWMKAASFPRRHRNFGHSGSEHFPN